MQTDNPSPERLQRLQLKIAEVQGWKDLKWHTYQHFTGDSDIWLIGVPPGREGICRVPNWPTNRNASYELPVEDTQKLMDPIPGMTVYYSNEKPDRFKMTACHESLAWLLYKGWRWEECGACMGGGKCSFCHGAGSVPVDAEDEEGGPIQGADNCPYCKNGKCDACNGEGGKWVKV